MFLLLHLSNRCGDESKSCNKNDTYVGDNHNPAKYGKTSYFQKLKVPSISKMLF